jgi:hypothetical protein
MGVRALAERGALATWRPRSSCGRRFTAEPTIHLKIVNSAGDSARISSGHNTNEYQAMIPLPIAILSVTLLSASLCILGLILIGC